MTASVLFLVWRGAVRRAARGGYAAGRGSGVSVVVVVFVLFLLVLFSASSVSGHSLVLVVLREKRL